MTDLKHCSRCGEDKALDAFYPRGGGRGGSYHRCKEVSLERYYAAIEADPDFVRRRTLKRRYGISLEQYDEMLAAQGGTCVCGRTPESCPHGVLHVDHDHKTNRVRGLLCPSCNRVLGLVQDRPDLLRALAEYLS